MLSGSQLIPEKRRFKKLRVSLTNQCNFACTYCVPEHNSESKLQNTEKLPSSGKRLTPEELLKTIEALHQVLNLKAVRFTGGEPLLFNEIATIVKGVVSAGIPEIGLTTNGFLLPFFARKLKKAGLKNINISIDASDPQIFQQITRTNTHNRVLGGIESAIGEGFKVKLNAVILRGVNDSQVIPLLDLAIKNNITIRFIEFMKMGHLYESNSSLFFGEEDILEQIATKYNFSALKRESSATANYWQLDNGAVFGIIANESTPFCSDCDRLRLNEYGEIYGCISSDLGIPVYEYIHNQTALNNKLHEALLQKKTKFTGSLNSMLALGG